MPGTTIRDAITTALLGTTGADGEITGESVTADITIGTDDFTVPHPGRCYAVLDVGAVTGTNPTAVVNVAVGDGTNWARVATFFIDEDDANTTFSALIDDAGNGEFVTVEVDVGGTTPDFTLGLDLRLDHHDQSPLMNVGESPGPATGGHVTPSPALPDLTD